MKKMIRAENIKRNLEELIEQYNDAKERGELNNEYWWENEFGVDLTDGIDCHVVFKDEPPCLVSERKLWGAKTVDELIKKQSACAECKAIWLMREDL